MHAPNHDVADKPNYVRPFANASFLYWLGSEGGLLYATNGILGAGGTLFYSTSNTNLSQSFDYKPGFKLGVGVEADQEWAVAAEYTWLRGKNSVSQGAPTAPTSTAGTAIATSGTPVWVIQDWFLQATGLSQALSGTHVTSNWEYNVDLIDVSASRPYSQGPAVTILPFGGLRIALIGQKVHVTLAQNSGQPGITVPSQPIHSNNKSSSWAIGPRLGCEINYLLPAGFRIEGPLAVSLLYTRYTKLIHKEDAASTTFNAGPYVFEFKSHGCLRPVAEMGLGFGWGRYLRKQTLYVDFSASYDFSFFWAQNMISQMLQEYVTGSVGAPEHLYFHGLTLSGRLDF